jgi:histidyl-tRNA synthetase
VVPGPQALPAALAACEALRAAGLSVQMHAAGADGWGGMKAQFRRADASGARHALVFGDDELARGEVAVKALRDATAPQRLMPLADLGSWARTLTA